MGRESHLVCECFSVGWSMLLHKYSGFPVWRKETAWTQVSMWVTAEQALICFHKSCCPLFLWWSVSPCLAGNTWWYVNYLWWLKPAAFPFCLSKSQTRCCLKQLLGSCLYEFEGQLGKLNLSIFWKSTGRQPETVARLSVICSVLCLGPRDRPGWIFAWNKWESYHFHGSPWKVHPFR